jgi:hypothetical protein
MAEIVVGVFTRAPDTTCTAGPLPHLFFKAKSPNSPEGVVGHRQSRTVDEIFSGPTNNFIRSSCLASAERLWRGAGPQCDSSETRNAVVRIVSGDSNNALADYAAKNSGAVQARVNNASTEAEKQEIWEKARQVVSYRLSDAISTNSKRKDKRTVTCSGSLSTTLEDAKAQKKVDFKVERTGHYPASPIL